MPPKKSAVPKPPPGKFFESAERGISIYYEVNGPNGKAWKDDKAETLFMLLGSTADLRKTADQQYINQSVSMFQIVTYDHRNAGRTTIKDEPCTMDDYADDAAALIEGIIPEKLPVYVIGISFGGMVAQHLAIRHPHLVKKLVLCCCATGGEGGMSFPIHQWYEPGISIEDRIESRLYQANTDRTPEWKEKSKSEFTMTMAILSRDEKVGAEDPLRKEGIKRQLDARKLHDTWDKIGQLKMDVLCLGSPKDNITQTHLMENLANRIGDNCERKLDFDWGHPFIAADVTAMPFVNDWLRKPCRNQPVPRPEGGYPTSSTAAAPAAEGGKVAEGQNWEVVGGGAKGGIVVRAGMDTSSEEQADRLSTGAIIRELELKGSRLQYKLLSGTGPSDGWVSVKFRDSDLVVKTDKKE